MGERKDKVNWQEVLDNLTPDEKERIPDHYLNYQTEDEFQNLKHYLMRSDFYRLGKKPRRTKGGFRHRRSFRRTRRGSRRRSRRRR